MVGHRRRVAVRARAQRDPLRRQAPAAARPRRPRPRHLDEIAGLVEAAGGRTLGLFSSTRAAKQATEALRGRLDTPLLCQGDDSTMLLVKKFAEDEATSLFGTLSLWQGVDVPGPSLSCVIIDRIPFPRPDDPLVAARQRATDARGGNGFLSVSATHAALLLAQGAGRLLRGHGRPRGGGDPRLPDRDRPLRRLPARVACRRSGPRTTGRRSTRRFGGCGGPDARRRTAPASARPRHPLPALPSSRVGTPTSPPPTGSRTAHPLVLCACRDVRVKPGHAQFDGGAQFPGSRAGRFGSAPDGSGQRAVVHIAAPTSTEPRSSGRRPGGGRTLRA